MSDISLNHAWKHLSNKAVEIWRMLPLGTSITVGPSAEMSSADVLSAELSIVVEDARVALADLVSVSPHGALIQDAENDIWEDITLHITNGQRGMPLIVIENLLGQKEQVNTFLAASPWLEKYLGWCQDRIDATEAETSWDEARKKRVIVDYEGTFVLIDQGANRILELLTLEGIETYASCEGHPDRAYVAWRKNGADSNANDSEVLAALKSTGHWQIEQDTKNTVIRMKNAENLSERNAIWRETCTTLEQHLGVQWEPERTIESLSAKF